MSDDESALRPSTGAGEVEPPWERCSDARLRELWREHGGGVRTKKALWNEAFSEIDLLPNLLRRIIEGACNAKGTP